MKKTKWKHPETAAAWAVAIGFVLLLASAPWDRLESHVPPGVVDPASQRFDVGANDAKAGGIAGALHREHFTAFAPDGL